MVTNQNVGQWIKQTRTRLRIPQSRLAAFLTMKLGKDCNQARIHEMEAGIEPIPLATLNLLSAFFQQTEQLRKQRRHWRDVFFL